MHKSFHGCIAILESKSSWRYIWIRVCGRTCRCVDTPMKNATVIRVSTAISVSKPSRSYIWIRVRWWLDLYEYQRQLCVSMGGLPDQNPNLHGGTFGFVSVDEHVDVSLSVDEHVQMCRCMYLDSLWRVLNYWVQKMSCLYGIFYDSKHIIFSWFFSKNPVSFWKVLNPWGGWGPLSRSKS